MPALPAPEVALLLREFGQRTALRGGNPYRSKAYTRAAENLLALTEPLEDLVAEGRLTEIPGVGDAIADIITKLHKTGDHPSLQSMRKEMPADTLEMLSIPGLRPDKVLKIYKELGVASLDELEKAAKEDRLKPVKGLGAALQANVRVKANVTCIARPSYWTALRSNCAGRNSLSSRPCLPETFVEAASS
jgi:DNA polymerase (family X)